MGTLTEAEGHDHRLVRGSEGLAAGSDGNRGMASGAPAMAEAFTASANPLADVLPDDDDEVIEDETIQCDVCLSMVHTDEICLKWCGGFETWACAACCEIPPSVDPKIDLMRGK